MLGTLPPCPQPASALGEAFIFSLHGLDIPFTPPSSTCSRRPFGSQYMRSSGLLFLLADLATQGSFNRDCACCFNGHSHFMVHYSVRSGGTGEKLDGLYLRV